MYQKIFDLLSKHSVAIAILIANIIAPIIISRAASKDKILQNKHEEAKETLHVLLQMLQQLETIKKSDNTEIISLSSALNLKCKAAIHLISKSKKHFPKTLVACKTLHNFLHTTNITSQDASHIKK